jgi:hypothetical protein
MTYLFTLISAYAAAWSGSVTDITRKRTSTSLVEKLGKKYLARGGLAKLKLSQMKRQEKSPEVAFGTVSRVKAI